MSRIFFLIAGIFFLFHNCSLKEPVDLTDFVDPFIGTGGHGHTFPGATLPFGMVQLSPDTGTEGWDWCSGYHASDSSIIGFSHTHLSGTGGADYGDILLMPTIGEWQTEAGTKENPDAGYRSRFSKTTEKASPGYYAVRLEDYGIDVALTATSRAGFHEYTFPESGMANIIIDLAHGISDSPVETMVRIINDQQIEGYRTSSGWASRHTVYFVAKFSRPFAKTALLDDEGNILEGKRELRGRKVKALTRFSTSTGEKVMVKVGISAVSIDGAEKNLDTEIPSWYFEGTKEEADKRWNEALGRIEVRGGTEPEKTIFYTALYHALIAPNLFTDVDGKYLGMDGRVHKAEDYQHYTIFSLWDTFRATHPLFTLVAPAENRDFVRSLIDKYRQSGALPIWELAANETGTMIGYHSVPVIADAILKGHYQGDQEEALEAMKHSAEQEERGLYYFKRLGYIPADEESNSVSKAVEYAYDDWCIAQVARKLGKEADYQKYLERSLYYRNHYDKRTHFLRPRLLSGLWKPDFQPGEITPLGAGDYTEGNAWHYNFFAPHDINGLISLHGSDQKFTKILDRMFNARVDESAIDQADVTGLIGQYAHGNEPSHHVAYLYNYTGQPQKAQDMVRRIMKTMYSTQRDGLAGNEDCGQMSAWYVFSAMGFYPVNPSAGVYLFGAPIFDKVILHLENGKEFILETRNNGPNSPYIQSAKFNGNSYNLTFIRHEDIEQGGKLTIEMGEQASASFGVEAAGRPVAHAGDEPVAGYLLPEKVFAPYPASDIKVFRKLRTVTLNCLTGGARMFYTLDNSEPDSTSIPYTQPIPIRSTATLKAIAYKEGYAPSEVFSQTYFKGVFAEAGAPFPRIELKFPPVDRYNPGGQALIDGQIGSARYGDGYWSGFLGEDLIATIDLGTVTPIHQIAVNFLEDTGVWIFPPEALVVALSNDGETFRPAGQLLVDQPPGHRDKRIRTLLHKIDSKARYLRIEAKSLEGLPVWHQGSGNHAWIFVDEILVEPGK